MDISTIIGLLIAFGSLIGGFIIEKGDLISLVHLSPIIIVLGGTIGATVLSCGISDFVGSLKSLMLSFFTKNGPQPEKLITRMSEFADLCRRDGILKLQDFLNDPEINTSANLPLKEGLVLVLDMKTSEEIQETMEADTQSYTVQKQMEIEVFKNAGGYSPTMGVIGTVMGLIQVLGNMSDADELTKSIGVAFVATLYGVVFANVLFLPAANRLKNLLKRQTVYREMMTVGMCLVASGRTSRDVVNQLSMYYHAFPGKEKKYKEGINN